MSPRKQLSEIDRTRYELAAWLDRHPDGPEHYHAALEPLVLPGAAALGWGETEIRSLFTLEPVIGMLRGLAYERAVRLPWTRAAGTPMQAFLAAHGRRLPPAGRAYLRALSEATTGLFDVVSVEPGHSVSVRQVGAADDVRRVHEFSASTMLSPGQHLLAEILPVPDGRVFAAGMLPIDADRLADLAGLREQALLRAGVTAWAIPMFRQAGTLLGFKVRERPDESVDRQSHERIDAEPAPAPATEPGSRKRLLERIRKLYAMAQQTEASPHEAEIALRRCQSLMARFGITEADLETSDLTADTAWRKKRVPMHVQDLAVAVGKLHDVLFVLGYDACPEFRGFEIDVRVAKLTLDYLVDATERALGARRRAGEFPPGRRAAYDYRRAFAFEVGVRIEAIVEERERTERTASTTGTALTLRKREIVERECGRGLTWSSPRTRRAYHADAVAAGREDGARVSLDTQVERAASTPLLPKR